VVLVVGLSTLRFRNLVDGRVALPAGLTVVHGANGAGKTNLLEGLFFGLTGRSCRTGRERELIAFGEGLARSEVELEPDADERAEPFTMLASVSTAEGRRRRVAGREPAPEDDRRRPALSVFMPDRLALVKGPPAPRRAHLDRLSAALWPARAEGRAAYGRALAQRNALLSRIRAGADGTALDAWDLALAESALPLVETRERAAAALAQPFVDTARALGLGEASLSYRPQTEGAGVGEIVATLAAGRRSDIARGFTGWGPHRDEVVLTRGGRSLRRYGSQGQQRVALLALLFAERDALRAARRAMPLMLLDDVMSELDPERRRRLVELLDDGGQALLTTTESTHVPDGERHQRLLMAAGRIDQPAPERGEDGG
jgi:DNA replication and repair protein RecF